MVWNSVRHGRLPADGTNAAAEKSDFGTSRWQLSDKTTPFAVRSEGGAMSFAVQVSRTPGSKPAEE
jgi:hypothetical protein